MPQGMSERGAMEKFLHLDLAFENAGFCLRHSDIFTAVATELQLRSISMSDQSLPPAVFILYSKPSVSIYYPSSPTLQQSWTFLHFQMTSSSHLVNSQSPSIAMNTQV